VWNIGIDSSIKKEIMARKVDDEPLLAPRRSSLSHALLSFVLSGTRYPHHFLALP
jgi:hypothetical protein